MPPQLIQQFVSSSGNTIIAYYAYDAAPCSPASPCDFRGDIQVPGGFDQVEVFISGFKLWMTVGLGRIQRASVVVQRRRYDSVSGNLGLFIHAGFEDGTQQAFGYNLTFVVILTRANVAQFTEVGGGCGGAGRCSIAKSLPNAVPPGMQYIGLGTYNWQLGSRRYVNLNAISAHVDSLVISPPAVNLTYMGVLQDASGANPMFLEWGAKVIAFDPTEMEQNGSPIFPQYTFLASSTLNRSAWTEHASSPSGSAITGFLNAFEGFSLFDPSALGPPMYPPPLVDKPIWLLECSASGFVKHPFNPQVALTSYGIFLGTQFGNNTTAAPFGYQASRAFGFLR